jgi:hypothetical protein
VAGYDVSKQISTVTVTVEGAVVNKQLATVVIETFGITLNKQLSAVVLRTVGTVVNKQIGTVVIFEPQGSCKQYTETQYAPLQPPNNRTHTTQSYSILFPSNTDRTYSYTTYAMIREPQNVELSVNVDYAAIIRHPHPRQTIHASYYVTVDDKYRNFKQLGEVTVKLLANYYINKNIVTSVIKAHRFSLDKQILALVVDPGERFFSFTKTAVTYVCMHEPPYPPKYIKADVDMAYAAIIPNDAIRDIKHETYMAYWFAPADRTYETKTYAVLQESQEKLREHVVVDYAVLAYDGNWKTRTCTSYLCLYKHPPEKFTTTTSYSLIVPPGTHRGTTITSYTVLSWQSNRVLHSNSYAVLKANNIDCSTHVSYAAFDMVYSAAFDTVTPYACLKYITLPTKVTTKTSYLLLTDKREVATLRDVDAYVVLDGATRQIEKVTDTASYTCLKPWSAYPPSIKYRTSVQYHVFETTLVPFRLFSGYVALWEPPKYKEKVFHAAAYAVYGVDPVHQEVNTIRTRTL